MPLYDFRCDTCQMTQERMAKYEDVEQGLTPKCKKCGGETRKQLSAPGLFDMKGPGFHCNDYKQK